jgi:LmbE family N-acetylglucosaminyl deacetylase
MAPDEAGPLREEEERRSAAVVGVASVEFLGHPDGAVEYGLKLRRDLARTLRRLRPEIVIGMNFDLTWGDGGHVNHVDHRAVGLGTLDACRDAANEWMFTDLGGPWNGVKAIYIHGATTPTHYVDVTSTIEAGVSSLREHRAYIQALGTEFDPDDFLRKSAAQGGSAAGCDLAVLFRAFNSG